MLSRVRTDQVAERDGLLRWLEPDGRVRVFVAADTDDQGIDGAHRLADRLREGRDGRPPVTQASVLVPEGAKDLRERVAAGLTPRQMADAIGVRLRERGASL